MGSAWEAIQKALKSGHKTSEFFVALLAIFLPLVTAPLFNHMDPIVQTFVEHSGWIGGLVAAVYIAVRGYVKGQTVKSEAIYPAAVAHDIQYIPDAASVASVKESLVTGLPPRPTGGNIGGYDPPPSASNR